MATFIEKQPEKLMTCPFDSNHKVKPTRYQQHISKCQKKSKVKLETYPKEEYNPDVINSIANNVSTQNACFEPTPSFPNSEYAQEDDWESSCSPFVTTGLDKANVNKKLIECKHLNPFTIQRLSKSERRHLYAKRVEYIEAQAKLKNQLSDNSENKTNNEQWASKPVTPNNPEPELNFWYQESAPISKPDPKWDASDFPTLGNSSAPDCNESRYFKLIPSGFPNLDEFESKPLLSWQNAEDTTNQVSSTLRQPYPDGQPCGLPIKNESSCEPSLRIKSSYGQSLMQQSQSGQSPGRQPHAW